MLSFSELSHRFRSNLRTAANAVVRVVTSKKVLTVFAFLLGITLNVAAQDAGYQAGTTALTEVTTEIAKYIPIIVKLCYAIAACVAVVGGISVYIAMNNEEQDVKKKIMITVGSCIFFLAAATALPKFFGY